MEQKKFSLSCTKAARILRGVFFAGLLAAILAGACLSLLSYHHVLSMLNQYAADGMADTFPEYFFTAIILRMRLFALCALITASFAWVFRARILEYIQNVLCSTKIFFADIKSAVSALAAETNQHVLCICSIFILGFILRTCFIAQPMRFDEAHAFINYASKPLVLGLTLYSEPNNHLLNTLLMHMCHILFGNSPWVLRLPAFCAGLLLMACFYCCARFYAGRQAALLSAGLIATSPVLIEYSTNARGYMLETLFFGMLLLLMHYLKRTDNALASFLFSLCAALGFYTVPVMVYPYCMIIVAIAVWFTGKGPDGLRIEFLKRFAVSFLLTIGITIIFYLPVVIVSGADFFTGNSLWEPKGLTWLFSQAPQYVYTIWLYWNKGLPESVIVLLTAGFIVSLGSPNRFWPTSMLILGVVGIIAFIRVPPVPSFNRVWIFAAPLYYAAAASGLVQLSGLLLKKLPPRKLETFTALLCMSIALVNGATVFKDSNKYFEGETGSFRDAERVAQFLKPQLGKNDKIICQCPSGQPLQYYFIREHIPLDYFMTDTSTCRRLIVVVNTFHKQTEADVLREEQFNADDFGASKLLAAYETGLIYEMTRK